MEKRSLGLIETWGYIPAIEAADAGSKAANVILLGYETVGAGLVAVKFAGDVAAVVTAVAAARAAARKVGKVVSVHVIPRLDRQLRLTPPVSPPPAQEKEAAGPPETSLPREDKGVVPASEAPTSPKEKQGAAPQEPAPPPERMETEPSPEAPTPLESRGEKSKKAKGKKK